MLCPLTHSILDSRKIRYSVNFFFFFGFVNLSHAVFGADVCQINKWSVIDLKFKLSKFLNYFLNLTSLWIVGFEGERGWCSFCLVAWLAGGAVRFGFDFAKPGILEPRSWGVSILARGECSQASWTHSPAQPALRFVYPLLSERLDILSVNGVDGSVTELRGKSCSRAWD